MRASGHASADGAPRIAFLYAGQGSQAPGMGHDLFDSHGAFRRAWREADRDGDIEHLCFEGTIEELSDTRNTQPAMVAFETAATALIRDAGILPCAAAGLSLGEYAALEASGVFAPNQAVELVRFRGTAMADAVIGIACGMVAVLGLDRETVKDACLTASKETGGVAETANFNCPGQIVISGDAEAVDRAAELARARGAKGCMPLNVSGAFHTSLMKPAGEALAERFAVEAFGTMDFPVIFNATGLPLGEGETVAELLVRQVQSSVRFEETVRLLEAEGVDTMIEIGPGKTLSKLVRKTAPHMNVLNVGDCASFEKTIDALSRISERKGAIDG